MAPIIVSSVLAALLILSAALKLSGREAIVASYERLGIPATRLPLLAGVLLLGAAGLLVGFVYPPLGVAAAACLAFYFAAAIGVHVHKRSFTNIVTPVVIEALAVASAVLQLCC